MVRQLIATEDYRSLTMERVARQLKVSPRTLRDRLSREGTSYKQILDNQRRQSAMQLLTEQQLTLDQIADALGYSDATNDFAGRIWCWFSYVSCIRHMGCRIL